MSNVFKEIEILRKNKKMNARDKNTIKEMKVSLKDLLADQTCVREESLSLRIYQQKPPKLKNKSTKTEKRKKKKDHGTITKGVMYR